MFLVTAIGTAKPVPVTHHGAKAASHDGSFGPFEFTSTYNLIATPDRVVNADSESAPGEAGSMGFYNYGINSKLDIICYVSDDMLRMTLIKVLTRYHKNITLFGVTGPYDSPAVTATHIHQAAEGAAGPPRIAFPNPEPADSGPEVTKRSFGCIQGPFTTGVKDDAGVDTGDGFKLAQIEADPAAFFTDSHTVVSVPGVVRAQLKANPGGEQAATGIKAACTVQVLSPGPPPIVLCLD